MKIALSLCLISAIYADNSSTGTFIENRPPELKAQEALLPREKELIQYNDVIVVPNAKGVALLSPDEKAGFSFKNRQQPGVHTYGLVLPGSKKDLDDLLTPLYENKDLSRKGIYEIRKAVVQFYQNHGHPLVTVVIPEQDVTQGVITMIVFESKLEKLDAYGAKWFSNDRIKSNFRMKEGSPVNQRTILEDLQWVNKNPFHKSNVIYSAGNTPDTTVVEVVTEDRFPLRPYVGIDNTGIDTIGRNRFYGGITWGNAFWVDQQLTYQYTSSWDFYKFQSHTAYYQIPFPWRHILNVYGGYSSVHPHLQGSKSIPGGTFKSKGMGVQASGRYNIPLRPFDRVLQEVTVGFDFKRTNTTLFFSETPIFGKLANLSQFMVGYSLGHEGRVAKTSLQLDLFWSPGAMMDDEKRSDYASLRPGATPRYFYGRAIWGEIFRLPGECSLSLLARGQASTQPLLPSEQYGLGGYNTVRGYDEQAYLADDAFNLNTEFRSPVFPLFIRKGAFKDQLQLLAFVDYGFGHNLKKPPGEKMNDFLISIGPGLRYMIGTYLNARIDWGINLHKLNSDTTWSKVHFAVTASY